MSKALSDSLFSLLLSLRFSSFVITVAHPLSSSCVSTYGVGTGTVEGPAVYGMGTGTVEGPAVYGMGTGTVKGPAVYGVGTRTVEGPAVYGVGTGTVEGPAVYGVGTRTVEGPAVYGVGTGTVEGPAVYGMGTGTVKGPAVYGMGTGTVEGPAVYGVGVGTVEGPGSFEHTSNCLFFSSALIFHAFAAWTCLLVLFGRLPDIALIHCPRWLHFRGILITTHAIKLTKHCVYTCMAAIATLNKRAI